MEYEPRITPRITIVPDAQSEAAIQIMDAIREAGLDPRRYGNHPEVRAMWQRWVDNEVSRADFVSWCILFKNNNRP